MNRVDDGLGPVLVNKFYEGCRSRLASVAPLDVTTDARCLRGTKLTCAFANQLQKYEERSAEDSWHIGTDSKAFLPCTATTPLPPPAASNGPSPATTSRRHPSQRATGSLPRKRRPRSSSCRRRRSGERVAGSLRSAPLRSLPHGASSPAYTLPVGPSVFTGPISEGSACRDISLRPPSKGPVCRPQAAPLVSRCDEAALRRSKDP